MKSLRNFILLTSAFFYSAFCQAQAVADEKPEMATGMRADGKIYVVIAIVLTILFILLAYLVTVDRKIGRLEKRNSN